MCWWIVTCSCCILRSNGKVLRWCLPRLVLREDARSLEDFKSLRLEPSWNPWNARHQQIHTDSLLAIPHSQPRASIFQLLGVIASNCIKLPWSHQKCPHMSTMSSCQLGQPLRWWSIRKAWATCCSFPDAGLMDTQACEATISSDWMGLKCFHAHVLPVWSVKFSDKSGVYSLKSKTALLQERDCGDMWRHHETSISWIAPGKWRRCSNPLQSNHLLKARVEFWWILAHAGECTNQNKDI